MSDHADAPKFPRTALEAERTEVTALELEVLEGALPSDSTGYVYFSSPVGTVASGGAPFPDRPSVINGDGMLFRLHLQGSEGKATLDGKIIKGPDYYADVATHHVGEFTFRNFGLMRGGVLGLRDYGNTAPLPLPYEDGHPPRLLACYDAGRHFEMDPATLETMTPVGYTDEWRPEVFMDTPFPPVLATAHPFFDPHTGEFFTVNYGRSTTSILETIPVVYAAAQVPVAIERVLMRFGAIHSLDPSSSTFWKKLASDANELFHVVVEKILGIDMPENFLYVVRWDGKGRLERWRVTLPSGLPAVVQESCHQVAVTRNYVVVMDTAFKLRLEQFYADLPTGDLGDRLITDLLRTRQLANSRLFVIPRDKLTHGDTRPHTGTRLLGEPSVPCRYVQLPLSATHFLADFKDEDDTTGEPRLVLHVGHGCALDIGEWVRASDLLWCSLKEGHREKVDPLMEGMIASEVDVSRCARYVVDPTTGFLESSEIVSDDAVTWGMALYAGHEVPTWGRPPERFESLYWFCSGLWQDLMTEGIRDLYADYPDRLVSLEQIDDILCNEGGRPSTLFRLSMDPLRIADCYSFEPGVTLSSPQFIPRSATSEGQTDGWIFCTVYTQQDRQMWLFDAARLAEGPICKLRAPGVVFGFSMHSCWMPVADSRADPPYAPIDVQKDVAGRLRWDRWWWRAIPRNRRKAKLFEDYVYPRVVPTGADT